MLNFLLKTRQKKILPYTSALATARETRKLTATSRAVAVMQFTSNGDSIMETQVTSLRVDMGLVNELTR